MLYKIIQICYLPRASGKMFEIVRLYSDESFTVIFSNGLNYSITLSIIPHYSGERFDGLSFNVTKTTEIEFFNFLIFLT